MKKFNLAMLALALVVVATALAFVGCKNEPDEESKTIEDLFAKVGSYDGFINWAYKGDDVIIYCSDHKAWETMVWYVGSTHGEPPVFTLAEADMIHGYAYFTSDSPNIPAARNLISALDSFYSSKYKLSTPPRNIFTFADGTPLFAWYSYELRRDGRGLYGASATATQAPCMVDFYQF